MSNNTRVFNVTRGFSMKHSQAVKAVDNCACAWVDFGVSVRDLSLAESISMRNKQAAMRDPFPFAELPNIHFKPPAGKEGAARLGYRLTQEANQFAEFATLQ